MSWSFNFTAADKGEAKQKVAEQHAIAGLHFPPEAVNALNAAIDMLPDNPEADVRVETWGHIDQREWGNNGNSQIVVRTQPRTPDPT